MAGAQVNSVQIGNRDIANEPCFFFTLLKYNKENTGFIAIPSEMGLMDPSRKKTIRELVTTNPPLHYFKQGLVGYFSRWEVSRSGKEAALKAADAFLASTTGREAMLDKLMTRLGKASPNEQKVAIWSSFMFTNHFWVSTKANGGLMQQRMILYNEKLEIPLGGFSPRLRGEVKYLNKYI